MLYIFIINNTNVRLKTKVEETVKQQKILSVQNLRLIDEIKKRRQSEELLAFQASHDALTELPNRKFGHECLEQELERARKLGSKILVVFIDLDNFKQINDTLGHLVGDHILTQTTQRLLHAIRPSDVLARFGGDEFLLVIPNLESQDSAKLLANRLLALFDTPFEFQQQEFFLSISIGLAIYSDHGLDTKQLLANADTAMYKVKQEGRNSYNFYNEDMNTDTQRALNLDARLRQAISNQDIQMYYQPLIELSTGRIVGAEALMRWQDEKFGFVPPDEFIPLAERNGLIQQLGEFALHTACQQAAQWQAISPLSISINFSSLQFRHCDTLFEQIQQALSESGLTANLLDIEITESLLFNHNDQILQLLHKLRDMGANVTS